MRLSMFGSFQILKKHDDNYIPQTSETVKALSIGGYGFEIGEDSVPFDWDAFSCSEENGVFNFETGTGWFFNDYEISDCYDDAYEEIGLKRENITAEFLASVHHIDEFFANFDDENGKECEAGWYDDNAKDSQYKINIMELAFHDLETDIDYNVKQEVLDKYNKGAD